MRSLLDVWGRMQLFPAGVLQHTTALADAEDAADAAAGAQARRTLLRVKTILRTRPEHWALPDST